VRRVLLAISLALPCIAVSACGQTAIKGVHIVAAENFWGSIAGQVAGPEISARSIITNPAQDPHDYEPTAADARLLATANLVIVNGVGYDPWIKRLLAANPVAGRRVLVVGDLRPGENPHRWYDPAQVELFVHALEIDLQLLDRTHGAYYAARVRKFETTGLAKYHRLIRAIRARYAGTPVGASESIFSMLAPALGLRLITPPSFMNAISEGSDITAQDTLTTQQQIDQHQIKVWIYNSQNATPTIQHLNALARAHGIPVTTITETLSPSGATFQQWQAAQLQRLMQALHQATNR
jgi:zinc/manganese transport system substrate-binding protein